MITVNKFWQIFSDSFKKVKEVQYPSKSFIDIYRYNRTYTEFTNRVYDKIFSEIVAGINAIPEQSKHILELNVFGDQRRLDHYFSFSQNGNSFNIAIEQENSFTQNVCNEEIPKLLELDKSGKSDISVLVWGYNVQLQNVNPEQKVTKIIDCLRQNDVKLNGRWLVILGPGYFSGYQDYLNILMNNNYDFLAYEIDKNTLEFKELERLNTVQELL